jgi:DNA mismatch endonuclease (patch repair protein)
MDRLTKVERSWNMSRIRNKDTKPEMIVRSALHKLGFRYRLHAKNLPGHPDIVLSKYHTVIFVHGCFWHGHSHCKDFTPPKTRTQWWVNKINGNIHKDKLSNQQLKALGWRIETIWECELVSAKKEKTIKILVDELKS